MAIHPTAIINPDAQIAHDASIGAYVTIEGPAIVGAGSTIEAHASLVGKVIIGKSNYIGHGSVIGGWPQDTQYNPDKVESWVEIGEGNLIREHCTINRGAANGSCTVVGDNNMLMAGSHLGHNCKIGNRVKIANAALLGGYVHTGDDVFLGGASVYHQKTKIGRGAITQGSAGFSKNVPPYCIGAEINFVYGLNVVGLKRLGFGPQLRAEIKKAFSLLYLSGLNVRQALTKSGEQTWSVEAKLFWDFVEESLQSKRGICALAANSKDLELDSTV